MASSPWNEQFGDSFSQAPENDKYGIPTAVLVWRTESTHIIGAHTCRILSDFFTTTYVRDLHSQTTRCACHYTDNFVCIMLCLGFLQPNLRVLQSQTTVISVPATRHIISSNLCSL
jgi:hypothetical protein